MMLPAEAVNAYDLPARVHPSSLDHSLVTAIGITGRERRLPAQVISIRQKTYSQKKIRQKA
jgi:hypothetical protein